MTASKESERIKRAKKELLLRRKELVLIISQMTTGGEDLDLILSGQRLDDFLDLSPSLMVITNPKGEVFKINKSCQTILGYTQQEILNIGLWSLVHPDDLEKTTAVTQKQLQGNKISNFITRYKNKDGSYRILEWQATTVKDGYTYAYANDITNRNEAMKELLFQNEEKQKRADELVIIKDNLDILKEKEMLSIKLSAANKELEQFSYLASHDLQEPLRTISNYIRVFEDDYSEHLDETAHKYLASVNMATTRMSQLIQSLLEYSILGRNTDLAIVDCDQLIGNVISDLNQLMKTSGAVIEVDDMPTLNLYKVEIHALFQNLISNAIKFQKKNKRPEIKIRAEEIDSVWNFSISDNGIGIEPKYFERIFEIFQSLNPRSAYEGTGIGLAYCKKIVQLHSGKIWVESTLGKGTSFYFTLHNLTL